MSQGRGLEHTQLMQGLRKPSRSHTLRCSLCLWVMGLMVAGQESLLAIASRRFLRMQKAGNGRPFESGKATYRPNFFAT